MIMLINFMETHCTVHSHIAAHIGFTAQPFAANFRTQIHNPKRVSFFLVARVACRAQSNELHVIQLSIQFNFRCGTMTVELAGCVFVVFVH